MTEPSPAAQVETTNTAMTDSKPKITPPPHLMLTWQEEARDEVRDVANHFDRQSIQMIKAASWGWQQRDASVATELQEARDEELEACLEEIRNGVGRVYIGEFMLRVRLADYIWTARRPKPPSLQDQALDDLERIAALLMENKLPCDTGNIRRALESLPD